jgi:hypothetical protein
MTISTRRRIISETYFVLVTCAWSLSLIGIAYTLVRSIFYGDSGFLFFGVVMLSMLLYAMRQR